MLSKKLTSLHFNSLALRMLTMLCVLMSFGCAQVQQHTLDQVEYQLRANQPEQALSALQNANSFGRDNALLALNEAMILRYLGQYQESANAFEEAKRHIGILEPTSISETIASYTISEQFNTYKATTFEKLFIHLNQIMNYLALDQLDSARVEVMQIDIALTKLTESGHYRAAAVARYFSGLIFEALSEKDSAYIAFRQAHENYQQANIASPQDLLIRLTRLADALGQKEEYEDWVTQLDPQDADSIGDNFGELIILYSVDLAPQKVQFGQSIVDPDSGQLYRISLPRYESRNLQGIYFDVHLSGQHSSSEEFADIEAIAINELNKQMPALTRRALARNVSKHNITKKTKEKNDIFGELVNVLGAILEEADTRNWRTLPNRLHISSHPLEAGLHTIDIIILDENKHEIARKTFNDINIKAQEKSFLSFHWLNDNLNTY